MDGRHTNEIRSELFSDSAPIEMWPIGFLRTPFVDKSEAPRQATVASDVEGVIELFPRRGYEDALDDLARWKRIWVLFMFHLDPGFKPKVQPPRSAVKRGVFATRSPHRPNPIGMSVVRLDRVEGLRVFVRDVDMVDRTPVLDLKPYLPYADAFPDAGDGWLTDDPKQGFDVAFEPRAEAAVGWIGERGFDLRERLVAALRLGPEPHAYRRIKELGEGVRQIAVKAWRADFLVAANTITVTRIRSGYRPRELEQTSAGNTRGDEIALHRAFVEQHGS